ncbi:MAG: glycoside hydrolase family protein [Brevundimonas sp.]|uniref:glycoside hydrolase family protein n=1 Tax=Brevundimonas sp. TaxID=1871086 RepID=UPI0039195638
MSKAADNERFVMVFQQAHGLTADGWAGEKTFGALTADVAEPATAYTPGTITERMALELIGHEAIVPEWYLDSKRVGTWGIGVTNASGHNVDRYKDKPQTIARCIEIFLWLCRTKYGPEVLTAFAGHTLSEAQYGAALSFHYNTGAIKTASWVKSFKAGDLEKARAEIMNWRSPAEIIPRREKERDLFFDGKWSGEGKATVYDVSKPSYSPRWSSARKVDIRADIALALGAA